MAEPAPAPPPEKLVSVVDFINTNNLADWQRAAFLASSGLGLNDSAPEKQLAELLAAALHGRI